MKRVTAKTVKTAEDLPILSESIWQRRMVYGGGGFGGGHNTEGVSPLFHQDCQDACISAQTSLQGSAPALHISPSLGGRKDIIGRKGLSVSDDREKKRIKFLSAKP